ncbi:MAG: dTDP-4-dehydrorhamnose 3,5-epimerase [Leptospiraceae bacterium]|nr:dTDP-4-dehydrorhamnose 3,5-epimerase [Leptospiraceae bacterium]MCK6381023.1 dTDP-4-dehydrorhamnose 3,5-epimerase [Leptospiraceae bacterium]NUM41437.1 dTDP-4-dehydrorhamnose 3,5-epimerase [Leptospiraceae bacterium]
MKINPTEFQDLYIIEPRVFKDDRGFFYESYSTVKFQDKGINYSFVQDNHAKSNEAGVLRGLHYQKPPYAQTKLVRVIKGSVLDVVVDLRQKSPTFKKWFGIELSEENFLTLLVPPGFAHGYLVLEPNTEFLYKVDNFYNVESEGGIIWNDPELSIDWKIEKPILSEKDNKLPRLKESLNIF